MKCFKFLVVIIVVVMLTGCFPVPMDKKTLGLAKQACKENGGLKSTMTTQALRFTAKRTDVLCENYATFVIRGGAIQLTGAKR